MFEFVRHLLLHLGPCVCPYCVFLCPRGAFFCVRLVGHLLLISGRLSDHPVFPFGVPNRLPKDLVWEHSGDFLMSGRKCKNVAPVMVLTRFTGLAGGRFRHFSMFFVGPAFLEAPEQHV